jgi:large subunit ribosomal protein L3
MSIGLIGRKVGMTQVFQPDGTMVAVSVVQITPNTVTRLRTVERDGYSAVQLGAGERRRLTKPLAGQLKDLPRVKTIREFRLDDAASLAAGAQKGPEGPDGYTVGQTINVSDVFVEGDLVDVTGVSKGQGFAGTVKRHNFSRGPKTHGSDNYRKPGSIGPGTTPGRVYKGLKMGGHMGHERVTIKKLRVVRVDPERNLILVRGAVPGAPGALTFVRKA